MCISYTYEANVKMKITVVDLFIILTKNVELLEIWDTNEAINTIRDFDKHVRITRYEYKCGQISFCFHVRNNGSIYQFWLMLWQQKCCVVCCSIKMRTREQSGLFSFFDHTNISFCDRYIFMLHFLTFPSYFKQIFGVTSTSIMTI